MHLRTEINTRKNTNKSCAKNNKLPMNLQFIGEIAINVSTINHFSDDSFVIENFTPLRNKDHFTFANSN